MPRRAEKANALHYLKSRRSESLNPRDADGPAVLSGPATGDEYLAGITIGGQSFQVVIGALLVVLPEYNKLSSANRHWELRHVAGEPELQLLQS